jgi:hypothetical protein
MFIHKHAFTQERLEARSHAITQADMHEITIARKHHSSTLEIQVNTLAGKHFSTNDCLHARLHAIKIARMLPRLLALTLRRTLACTHAFRLHAYMQIKIISNERKTCYRFHSRTFSRLHTSRLSCIQSTKACTHAGLHKRTQHIQTLSCTEASTLALTLLQTHDCACESK